MSAVFGGIATLTGGKPPGGTTPEVPGTGGGAGNPHDWEDWRAPAPPGGPTTGPVGTPRPGTPGGGEIPTTNSGVGSLGGGTILSGAPMLSDGQLHAGSYAGPAGGLTPFGGQQSGLAMPGMYIPDLQASYAGANVVPGSMSTAGLGGAGGFGPGGGQQNPMRSPMTSALLDRMRPRFGSNGGNQPMMQGPNTDFYAGGSRNFDERSGQYSGGVGGLQQRLLNYRPMQRGAALGQSRQRPGQYPSYAEGGTVDEVKKSPEELVLERMRTADIGGSGWAGDPGGDLMKGRYDEEARRGSYDGGDGYVYTPIWERASNNASLANDDAGGAATFGGYRKIKKDWQYGDSGAVHDAEGKKVSDYITTAPDWIDKWGPRAALALIGSVAGGAFTNAMGWTNFGSGLPGAESVAPTGVESLGQNGAFLGEGVSSGVPSWDLAATNAGLELSATTPLSAFNPAADSQLANEAIASAGGNPLEGYQAFDPGTAAPAINGGPGGTNPNIPGGAPPAGGGGGGGATPPAASGNWYDSLLKDPFKLLSAAAMVSGMGGGGGGGGKHAGYEGGIPNMTASRQRIPRDPNRRPGSAPQRHFTDIEYKAAGGMTGNGVSGLLKGPGDGLSDSIEATIEGQQPARLARDEFVVPADVVSALGNGSSEAGAEHLYQMLERIRGSAHGKTEQQRPVAAKKVLPA